MRKCIYFLVILIFAACNDPASEGLTALDIEKMEVDFFGKKKQNTNESQAKQLTNAYITFQKQNPTDGMSAEYLFRAANLCKTYKDYKLSIELYRTIVNDYPTYKRHVESHFFIAFTYDNDLKDKEMANKVYKEVADKYPNENWGQVAATMYKEIVPMSTEELNEWLDEQNK